MADFTDAGKKIKQIKVSVSYQIINLFSGQLYQSPIKAVEELIANSYDAFAKNCHVLIPKNLSASDRIIVYDDGISMDIKGFEDLWTIARSRKREAESKKRLPIGRFGIGKLATYVLANKLTHVCKKDGKIRAITMDYRDLDPSEDRTTDLMLQVRELTEEQAKEVLTLPEAIDSGVKLPLFGSKAPDSWTVAILSDLKDKAIDLRVGRLRWVISSALPNRPDFRVFMNGERIVPTKEEIAVMKEWVIGKDDEMAEANGLPAAKVKGDDHEYEIEVDGIGPVWGTSELYEDFLTSGKAALMGRSHGIFVMVRGRLINHDDPNFGIPPLSHSTFNRYRLVIYADGLDRYLVASREGVMANPAVDALREYVKSKFNEARNYYTAVSKKTEYEQRLSTKLGSLPSGLIGRPLRNLVEQALTGEAPSQLTRVPVATATADRERLAAQIEEAKRLPVSLLKDVKPKSLGTDAPLAVFEAGEGLVHLNTDHPFYLNYSDTMGSSEPMDVMALAEVLTEAYLRDRGVPADVTAEIIEMRDSLLRQIVSVRPVSATAIAKRLREAGSDEKVLEIACGDAFKALGFEVTPLGGSGKPEGVATARLGYVEKLGKDGSYSLTYDAKSTSAEKVKAGNLSLGTVAEHRKDYKANFAVVVAKNFQTTEEGEELTVRMAKTQNITLIRSGDLADLVEAKAAKFMSLHQVRELFETCRTPEESRKWIDSVIKKPTQPPPVIELLEVAYELQKDGRDNVDLGAIKQHKGKLTKWSKTDLARWFAGLHSLVPTLILYNDATKTVEIHATPEKILAAISSTVHEMPDKISADVRAVLPEPAEGGNGGEPSKP